MQKKSDTFLIKICSFVGRDFGARADNFVSC